MTPISLRHSGLPCPLSPPGPHSFPASGHQQLLCHRDRGAEPGEPSWSSLLCCGRLSCGAAQGRQRGQVTALRGTGGHAVCGCAGPAAAELAAQTCPDALLLQQLWTVHLPCPAHGHGRDMAKEKEPKQYLCRRRLGRSVRSNLQHLQPAGWDPGTHRGLPEQGCSEQGATSVQTQR